MNIGNFEIGRSHPDYMRLYREQNSARVSELNRQRYLKNPAAFKDRAKIRYLDNKPDILAKQKEWRQRTKDRRAEVKKAWALLNRDKVREIARNGYYRRGDKIKKSEYGRAWRLANPDKVAESQRRYHRNHPEVRRAQAAARRAISKEDFRTAIANLIVIQQGRCYWCNQKYGSKFELDHIIPLARGGEHRPGNFALSCRRCNRSKGAKLPAEFAGRLI